MLYVAIESIFLGKMGNVRAGNLLPKLMLTANLSFLITMFLVGWCMKLINFNLYRSACMFYCLFLFFYLKNMQF